LTQAAGLRTVGRIPTWRGLLTLTYHRIAPHGDALHDPGQWSATPEGFDAQLAWLSREVDVVDPPRLGEVQDAPRGRHVLITFDDGYLDNYELAFPILRRHRLAAAFFISTGFIDRPRMPPWEEAAWMLRSSPRTGLSAAADVTAKLRTLPPSDVDAFLDELGELTGCERHPPGVEGLWMSWEMLRAMQAQGMEVGGHTVDHPLRLAALDEDEQVRQIEGCAARLREELGRPMSLFSYPVGTPGTYGQVALDTLERIGVQYAFANSGGYQRPRGWRPLELPRTNVGADWSHAVFAGVATHPGLLARY
jgi:peptidoglycan/xylan/chitin deacetylase (PgdA/CDA1 family)